MNLSRLSGRHEEPSALLIPALKAGCHMAAERSTRCAWAQRKLQTRNRWRNASFLRKERDNPKQATNTSFYLQLFQPKLRASEEAEIGSV